MAALGWLVGVGKRPFLQSRVNSRVYFTSLGIGVVWLGVDGRLKE
jgi:hypothetical protein